MADDSVFSKAADEQRRRERDAAVERARNEEDGGFSEIRGYVMEDSEGVPDHIRVIEVGAAFVNDLAPDHAGDN